MKKNLYNWIIIIIFVLVLGYGVISNIRYNNLKQDYDELKFKQENVIDSLKNDNLERMELISKLESEVIVLNNELDSLHASKQIVINSIDKFTVSQSISEGASLLKQNLNEKITFNNCY